MKPLAALVVYAYSSFVSQWGMGPAAAKEFEKSCGCRVELVNAGDAGSMLSKLKLEGESSRADVVVGMEETLLPKARRALGWRKLELPKGLKWSEGLGPSKDGLFAPFDHGPYAFIYDSERLKDPPRSLDDLLQDRFKGEIVLEDPRTSSVGLGFLLWAVAAKGERAWDFLGKLGARKKIVSPSWDLAYGLFKKGEALLVHSYWTSPAYHIQEEKVGRFKAAAFSDGHYRQVEYLGIPASSKNAELAAEFVRFAYSDFFQGQAMTRNFMLPALESVPRSSAMRSLGAPKLLPRLDPADVESKLDAWRDRWRELL